MFFSKCRICKPDLDIIRKWSSIFNMNSFSLLGSLLDSNYKEFFGFLTLGTVVYFGYGIRHSALNSPTNTNKKKHNRPEQKTSPSGVCLSPSNTNVKKKIASFLTKKTNKFCYDVRTVSVSPRARVPRSPRLEITSKWNKNCTEKIIVSLKFLRKRCKEKRCHLIGWNDCSD